MHRMRRHRERPSNHALLQEDVEVEVEVVVAGLSRHRLHRARGRKSPKSLSRGQHQSSGGCRPRTPGVCKLRVK